MSTGTNGGQESHVQLSRAGALGPEWTPPVPRYRLTLTITGNTLDEIEHELVVQTRGGFLLDSVPKYDAELAAVAEPDEEAPTPERPAGPVTDVKPTFVDDVDPATLADLLQLVQEGQREVTVDEIAAWDKDTRCDVADWASALHLLASDNDDVEVPEMPEVLRPVPDVADEDGD